jgi:hypothetical protein
MARPPKPPFVVRYTQAEALAALRLNPSTPLIQLAEAAGIALGKYDTLSEAQIRLISEQLDRGMLFPAGARYWEEAARIQRQVRPRRGRANAEEGLARLESSKCHVGSSDHAKGGPDVT